MVQILNNANLKNILQLFFFIFVSGSQSVPAAKRLFSLLYQCEALSSLLPVEEM